MHAIERFITERVFTRTTSILTMTVSVFCVALALVYETNTWQGAVKDLRASTAELRASNARLKADDRQFRQDASTAKTVALLAAHVSAELLKNQTAAYDYRLNVCLQERDSIRARVLGFTNIVAELRNRAATDNLAETRARDARFAQYFDQLAKAEEMSQVKTCNHPRINIRLKKL